MDKTFHQKRGRRKVVPDRSPRAGNKILERRRVRPEHLHWIQHHGASVLGHVRAEPVVGEAGVGRAVPFTVRHQVDLHVQPQVVSQRASKPTGETVFVESWEACLITGTERHSRSEPKGRLQHLVIEHIRYLHSAQQSSLGMLDRRCAGVGTVRSPNNRKYTGTKCSRNQRRIGNNKKEHVCCD